jgi:RNA polymerase sigma-70 factor (ECF subfamily)
MGAARIIRSIFAISDEQAMLRVQAHDDELAFAQLVARWEGPIQALCARMNGDEDAAQDLAQEAFVRVFSRRKEYRPTAKFSTWLWRIALNLCYDELRRRQRREKWLTPDVGGDALDSVSPGPAALAPPPDQALAEEERRTRVRETLLRLPEAQRAVLVLRHYENLKFREIAEVLGVPEGTVKSRMADALTQMGRLLRPLLNDTNDRGPGTEKQPKESLII